MFFVGIGHNKIREELIIKKELGVLNRRQLLIQILL